MLTHIIKKIVYSFEGRQIQTTPSEPKRLYSILLLFFFNYMAYDLSSQLFFKYLTEYLQSDRWIQFRLQARELRRTIVVNSGVKLSEGDMGEHFFDRMNCVNYQKHFFNISKNL